MTSVGVQTGRLNLRAPERRRPGEPRRRLDPLREREIRDPGHKKHVMVPERLTFRLLCSSFGRPGSLDGNNHLTVTPVEVLHALGPVDLLLWGVDFPVDEETGRTPRGPSLPGRNVLELPSVCNL